MSRRLQAVLAFAALLGARPAAAEWRGASLGVRGSYDVGGPFVSRTESGFGGGAFLRGAVGGDRIEWELSAALDVAGYVGEGDGDPIVQLTGNLARRAWLGRERAATRGFWSLGVGAGYVGVAGSGAAFPIQAKLGVAFARDGAASLELAAVERLTFVAKEGDASVEPLNGLGLELAVRFGR